MNFHNVQELLEIVSVCFDRGYVIGHAHVKYQEFEIMHSEEWE